MTEQGWTKVPNDVARSGLLSWRARLVYIALASRVNDEGRCWPSRKTIAKDAGVALSTVTLALAELRSANLVTWDQQLADDGTPCGSSTYALTGVTATRSGVTVSQSPPDRHTATGVTVTRSLNKTQFKKTHEQGAIDDRFDEFWAVYPKRQGKKPAQLAWAKALKTTDADAIIAGAKTYAAQVAGKDPKFTKYAQGWLTAERWTDEPDTQIAEVITPGLAAWSNDITEQRMRGEIA